MKNKRKYPKTAQQTIPYTYLYPDHGIIETDPGHFTRSYKLHDINFAIASEDEQKIMYLGYERLLNSFPTNASFQVLIHKHKENKRDTLKSVYYKPESDGNNKYRNIMNNTLIQKLSSGSESLAQDKYLIVSIKDSDERHAFAAFKDIDKNVNDCISSISKGIKTEPETLDERLLGLYKIYNKNSDCEYGNAIDQSGNRYLDLNTVISQGIQVKDIISPAGFRFEDNYFETGDAYGRVLFLDSFPSYLSTDFVKDLSNINCEMLISTYYKPTDTQKALKMIRNNITNINGEIGQSQKRAIDNNYSFDVLPTEAAENKEAWKDVLNDIVSRDQKWFVTSFLITVFADKKSDLVNACKQISMVANKYVCGIKTLLYQQEDGFNSCIPLAMNKTSVKRGLTTESASVFIPYTSQELFHKNGNFYGTNQITGNIIMYNRKTGKNFNGLYIGDPGSGKSFDAKSEINSVLCRGTDNVVYVIDPQGEYDYLATEYNGETIEFSPSSKTFLNPFDLDISTGSHDEPISTKIDYIMGMIEIMFGENQTLSGTSKSVINRCVTNIYAGYLQHMQTIRNQGQNITIDKNAVPTLQNLYNELLKQPEPEAKEIADVIEIYATGSYQMFSHRSNTDTNKRVVVYNIKNLGTGMKALGIYICVNEIMNKMVENAKKGIWTWVYIDEFWLLLQNENTAKYMKQMWLTMRKFLGVPTGLLQNTEELLATKTARDIANTTSFIMMHSVNKQNRDNLGEMLQIPESQLVYLDNAKRGTGLIYTGNTILPFDNTYPKDSPFYAYWNSSSVQDIQIMSS